MSAMYNSSYSNSSSMMALLTGESSILNLNLKPVTEKGIFDLA